MRNSLKLVLLGTTFFALSCIFDHITTVYGLFLPNVSEMNVNVLFLMGCGVWHLVEILIIAAGISSSYLALNSRSTAILRVSTIALLSGGFIRFFAGLHNLTIILNTPL